MGNFFQGNFLEQVAAAGAGALPAWPDPPNKKLHMKFEQDSPFLDSGDTGHTITTVGAVTADASSAKWGSKGGKFAGGYLRAPAHADWDFGTDPWGFEAWIRSTDAALNTAIVIGFGPLSTNRMIGYLLGGSDRMGVFWSDPQSDTLYGWPSIVADTWYHFAFARNADGVDMMWVDGALKACFWDRNRDFDWSGSTVRVGDDPPSGGFPWTGDIDELLVWSGDRGLEPRSYDLSTIGAY